MQRITDMTCGKPAQLIFFFSLPLMLGGVFQQLYMIVDTIIVGRGVGIHALASLGAADWINWMVLWAIHGFTHGFSVLIAQEFGAGRPGCASQSHCHDRQTLHRIRGSSDRCKLVCRPASASLLHTENTVIGGARLYLYVQFSGTLVIIAYNMAAAILRCLGDSRTPLSAIIVASFVNIVLDLLFVLVFHWGIFGAAIATVFAQLCSFLFCMGAMRRLPLLHLQPEDWKNDRSVLMHLCRLGIPTALQNSIIAIGGLVVQFVLNGFGFVFVAGFTATNKLYGMLESTAIAFGYAMTAYMGQNRGAGLTARIDAGMHSVLLLSAGFSTVISVSMLLFGRNILRLFVSSSDANAHAVLEIAYRYLFIMSCLLFVLFLVHAYRSVLQGLGNTTVPMLSGLVEMVVRIGVALLLPRLIGENGIFFAEVAAWSGAASLMMIYYYVKIHDIKCSIQTHSTL